MNRRDLICASAATAACAVAGLLPKTAEAAIRRRRGGGLANAQVERPFAPQLGARSRVLIVNDLSGDVDGLFATAHSLLSPAVDVRGIVGTAAAGPTETAQRSVELARELLAVMDLTEKIPLHQGSSAKLSSTTAGVASPGAKAIVDEAMREDTSLPLFVTVGGGLTEVASALLLEPRIADRFTLIWIGGDPYPRGGAEYNFGIDRLAAQAVFNDSAVRIWQIPSNAYGMCQVSLSEMQVDVAPHGKLGRWLYAKLIESTRAMAKVKFNTGESWTMGDNPLVLLTALTTWFPSPGQPRRFERTGSSLFDEIPAPRVEHDGTYRPTNNGRTIRVYRSIDSRMMMTDFYAKLRLNSLGHSRQ